jgi:hypothetical protein
MLYGNCAKDMQVYSRQDQLRSAAAGLPLRHGDWASATPVRHAKGGARMRARIVEEWRTVLILGWKGWASRWKAC